MITASKCQRFLAGKALRGTLAAAVAVAAVGCKTGSSWTAKPSWWTFGGGPEEASKLATAPPAPTDITKPSAASKPYPTTTTPEGYVLAGAESAVKSSAGGGTPPQLEQPAVPAAVTYGSRPAAPAVAEARPIAPAGGPQTGLSSITPQVGPYGSAPASAEQSPVAATTSTFDVAAGATAGEAAGTRVADARAADSWSMPPAAAPTTTESRYGSTGSRFSGGSLPAEPASLPAAPPAAFDRPTTVPAEVSLPPSSAVPAGLPAAPAPLSGTVAPPPPTRRPDPGYRPGGTSSYRTSRTIIAGSSGGDTGGVEPAAFEKDAGLGP